VSNGRIVGWKYTEHRLTRDTPSDQAVASIVADYSERLDAALTEVVGSTATPLDATRESSRSRETALGNLIADALREYTQADVAVHNGGGIRGEKVFEPGPLTRKDLTTILPLANYAAKSRLSGAALRGMLDLSVSSVEERHGRFLQVSGMSFTYDPAAPPGRRVREVLVGGAPLDDAAMYTVALNDFMQRGGDGYWMVDQADIVLPGQAGELLGNILADYVSTRGTVAPDVEGRIVAVAGE
jgi:2',3'-cyclic-nucleotide 2'-phosphodiesterase (5'-nucleotidase family)